MNGDDREDWNVWRDLVAPLVIIALLLAGAYVAGGVAILNP